MGVGGAEGKVGDVEGEAGDKEEGQGEKTRPGKRARTRYHLDVGAYGIPKRRQGQQAAAGGRHGLGVGRGMGGVGGMGRAGGAVQVGEDAYFVRENAMGIADGVGGWAKAKVRGREKGECNIRNIVGGRFGRRALSGAAVVREY